MFEESNDWLNLVDLDAIADPNDKVAECQYFLSLAERERDIQRFRWLISAFFGAAYSYFEISALRIFDGVTDAESGEPIEHTDARTVLEKYVSVRCEKRKHGIYVKTTRNHPITKELYELRNRNTHNYPLSIMVTSDSLPEGFHFGNLSGQGKPALVFCRATMMVIAEIERGLQEHY